MANTYTRIAIHYIFSTKNRKKVITEKLQKRLWCYMGGIARRNNITILAVGGIEDHVHILALIPPTISVAKAIQLIKGGSSKWSRETFSNQKNFRWQGGYSAFSVSTSRIEKTITYINNQRQQHTIKTFREEDIDFLEKQGIKYDEQYVW